MTHNLSELLEEISEYPHDLSARTYLKNLIEELQQLDTEKWLEENEDDMFNNYPPIRDARAFKFEDMLRYFIDRVILGET